MAGENKTEYKKLYRSVRGTPVAGSLVEGEKFTEARIKEGQFENTVRAYNDNQKKALKDAVEKGEPLFVRGVLGGSKKNDNVHLMVNSVNRPRDIEGEVLFIRRSGEGKAPYAGGFIKKVVEKEGKTHTFSIPFEAWGDEAASFADVKKGDTISGGVRERQITVTKKGGEKKREEGYEFVTAATVGPAAALASSKTQEMDTDPYPSHPLAADDVDWDMVSQEIGANLDAQEAVEDSTPSFTDEIPF